MEHIKKIIQKYGKTLGISIFLVIVFISGNLSGFAKNNQTVQTKVLSAHIHLLPSPTPTAVPTVVPLTIINNIIVPTQEPAVSPQVPTQTPMPTVIPASTPTPTLSVVPTETLVTSTSTPSPTLTPTPVPQVIEIDIDYAGEHTESTYSVSITSGETAWQAVQDAVGLANLEYTDYGGDLGIFITGFNGINASSNQYYDFQVNGTSSNVGVSSYIVQNNDVLKFVLTSD